MNVDRINQLALCIENRTAGAAYPDLEFNMGVFWMSATPDCGTTACIAGWAVACFGEVDPDTVDPEKAAQDILGLTEDQATNLFYPKEEPEGERSYYDSTPQEAAKVLRYLAWTGKVDWDMSRPPELME